MKRTLTSERAAACCLNACLAHIEAARLQTLATDDPEGPHQLRVGLRQLRTALGLFRRAIDSPRTRALAEEAKWLGQEVGKTRDLEVLLHEIFAPALVNARNGPKPHPFLDKLRVSAGRERRNLKKLLRGSRVGRVLTGLRAFVTHRQWLLPDDILQTERLANPVGNLALRALRNRWIAAESRAKHLERLSDTERHDLRKELKKLRYSVEFLAPFYPAEPVAAFQKQLKPLQADLGAWNDAATAKRLVDSEFAQDLTDPGALAEVANVVEALLAKAAQSLSDAEKHWTRLKSLPKPWA